MGTAGSREEGNLTWAEMTAHVAAELGDRNEACWVCETAGGFDAGELRAAADEWVPERAGKQIEAMLRRRLAGEPLQYVLGRWGFRRLDLMVDSRVLIPRPETEMIVDIVVAFVQGSGPGATVVDLGTGSGAIGLAVLDELPPGHATVWMTDASADALDVARANAAGAGRAAAGARFAHGNWYDALDTSLRGTVDVIVSNPPYVAEGDPDLDESVSAWEPSSALLSGGDGLDDLRAIVAGASGWLRPGGMLVTEMGHTQADELIDLYQIAGMAEVRVHRDLAGRDRFVSGVNP